jgi:hypothetical protein
MSGIPNHLSWAIIRNNNAFLLKKRNIGKPFSTVRNLSHVFVDTHVYRPTNCSFWFLFKFIF